MNQSDTIITLSARERMISFVWQHTLLLVSLFVMTLGVAVCVRSNLGSSVISSIPLALSLAGETHLAPALTLGEYTYCMNAVLVLGQILILRRRFEAVQLLQLVVGFFFGFLLDLNMWLTSGLVCSTLPTQIAAQVGGCLILGTGIAMEVRCGSVTMPGEGFPAAICKATGLPFPKAKIATDVTLVAIAVVLCYVYFGHWVWSDVGPGTLFAMFFVGMVVKFYHPRMGWFDRLLHYRPGFRRYLYGLARFIYARRGEA